jgi:RNA polymerase sigma factor (sigma-70 family)
VAIPCAKTRFPADSVESAAQIINEYGDFIRLIINLNVNDKNLKEDIFQDFFLSLVANPVSGSVENIKGYIYTAILHDIADYKRKQYRNITSTKKYLKKLKKCVNKIDPLDALIIDEERKRMYKLIKEQSLGKEYDAIILRYRDGNNIQRVAEKMGLKNASVRKYMSKGLKRVRKYLTNSI